MFNDAALIVAWTALVVAILKFLLDWFNAHRAGKVQETTDEQAVIAEYKKLVDGFNKQVAELWAELNSLQKQNLICQVESEKLKGEIRVLQAQLDNLRTATAAMDLKAWSDLRKSIEALTTASGTA